MAIFMVQELTMLLEFDIFFCEILGLTTHPRCYHFLLAYHNISGMLHSADPDVILVIYRK